MEEVEAEKEHMRAVDTRPIKKVAEAKARKRKRLQVRTCQLLRTISLSIFILYLCVRVLC